MASFGEQLRQARETQNISLQEIAASTKISSRALQALESEHFDQLPGGIFNKGFVRAYARYVGLDEEKMLEAYMAAAKEDGGNDLQTIADQVSAQMPQSDSGLNGNLLIGVLAILVALGLSAIWFREHRREVREQAAQVALHSPATQSPQPQPNSSGAPESQTSAAQTNAAAPAAAATPNATPNAAPAQPPAAVGTPAQSPSATTATAAPTTSASAPAGPVEIAVTATQKTWISVRSDGKMVDSLLLDPDNPNLRSRSYKANEKLRMVIGNAGGLDVVSNGKPLGSLGKPGQTAVVTFTAQGIEKH